MDNHALYPKDWTHLAYFAPRGYGHKRQEWEGSGATAPPLLCGGGREALMWEDERPREDLELLVETG